MKDVKPQMHRCERETSAARSVFADEDEDDGMKVEDKGKETERDLSVGFADEDDTDHEGGGESSDDVEEEGDDNAEVIDISFRFKRVFVAC